MTSTLGWSWRRRWPRLRRWPRAMITSVISTIVPGGDGVERLVEGDDAAVGRRRSQAAPFVGCRAGWRDGDATGWRVMMTQAGTVEGLDAFQAASVSAMLL